LRRLTAKQYANSVRDIFKGLVTPSEDFPSATTGISESGFSTDPDMNTVTQEGATNIMEAAEGTAVAVTDKLAQLLPCYPAQQDDACATTFVNEYAKRAYRRPLTSAEQSALLGVFQALKPNGFEVGIAGAVTAFLQAPQFLYRVEMGALDSGGTRATLTAYEVASRLSYLLWDTTPDDILLNAAAKGDLDKPEGIRTQADRLLSDARSAAAIVRFYREWTAFEVFEPGQKDPKLFPDYDQELVDSMQEQFDRFVVSSTTDATLPVLLTRKDVPINARLARFYGVAYSASNTELSPFTSAILPKEQASGLLTLPALLGGLAHPANTSVTFRGKLIRKKFLCSSMGNPPADAIQRLPEMPANVTPRQKAEILMKTPGCGSCHSLMDSIGLGFERFDAVGKYHATGADGKSVDDRGSIAGGISSGSDFVGVSDLGEHLANSDEVKSCLVKQWFRFTYSRLERDADACALKSMTDSFGKSGLRMRELVLSVVAPPSFRIRTLGGQP
jgi:hypothetical protein